MDAYDCIRSRREVREYRSTSERFDTKYEAA